MKGFVIEGIEIELTSFADDSLFFLKNTSSLERVIAVFKYFNAFSSLKANIEKCNA